MGDSYDDEGRAGTREGHRCVRTMSQHPRRGPASAVLGLRCARGAPLPGGLAAHPLLDGTRRAPYPTEAASSWFADERLNHLPATSAQVRDRPDAAVAEKGES
jgi:hypothetical protein